MYSTFVLVDDASESAIDRRSLPSSAVIRSSCTSPSARPSPILAPKADIWRDHEPRRVGDVDDSRSEDPMGCGELIAAGGGGEGG